MDKAWMHRADRDKRCLLAVHAHPDDETLTTGGTLARYAAEGVRTVVVTCTQGELGLPGDRSRELEAAANVLGVARLVQLGYADSGMQAENAGPEAFHRIEAAEAATRLIEVLEEEQPQVVVTYDETGGYGHPDHVKAHQVTVAACRRWAHGRLYFVSFPLTWSRRFVAALRRAGIDAPGSAPAGADAGPEVEEIGVPDERVTTRIDVRAYVDTKRKALACHGSQVGPDHFLGQAPADLLHALWAYEYFERVGPRPRRLEEDLFAAGR
jgi:LmbE family N-acetylglucosaminyl deacetylase